jgi:hypothetical protein
LYVSVCLATPAQVGAGDAETVAMKPCPNRDHLPAGRHQDGLTGAPVARILLDRSPASTSVLMFPILP